MMDMLIKKDEDIEKAPLRIVGFLLLEFLSDQ